MGFQPTRRDDYRPNGFQDHPLKALEYSSKLIIIFRTELLGKRINENISCPATYYIRRSRFRASSIQQSYSRLFLFLQTIAIAINICSVMISFVGIIGLEPMTSNLSGSLSNHLIYMPIFCGG